MRFPPMPFLALVGLVLAVPGVRAMLPGDSAPLEEGGPVSLARQALEGGRFDEARRLLEGRVAAGDADALHWLGRTEFEAGEIDRALDLFERAVKREPDLVRSHFWYGRACHSKVNSVSKLFQIKWARRLKAAFERASEIDPTDADVHFALVRFHREAPGLVGGDRELAWTHVRELARLDPALGEPVLAEMLREDEELVLAAEAYRRAILASPDERGLRYLLAITLADAGRAADSFAALDDLLKRQANDPIAFYLVGRTSAISGLQLVRGKAALDRYLTGDVIPGGPSRAAAHWRLGNLSEHAGDREAARRSYRAALRLDPDFKRARASLKALPRP